MSRSAFFTRAVQLYLDELDTHAVVRQIDEALAAAGTDDSATAASAAGRRRLAGEDRW